MRETSENWLKYVKQKGGETSLQLMDADIPVPEAVVEKFLHRGEMMILAGPPKAGKSVFVTQLSVAITSGGKFLGEFQAQRGTVIWYDVDDNDRHRAQTRLEDLGHDEKDENIVYFRKLTLITEGAAAQIDSDLGIAVANGQNVSLVIIDCLMGILGSGPVKNVVQDQRKQLEALRALAVKYNIGLLIIHHSPKNARRRANGASIFDSMLGTTGLGTVVDVGVLLEGTGRAGEMLARFEGRNPDTPSELTLKLDRDGRTGWHVIEGADQTREGSDLGRVALGIIQMLEKAEARLTPTEIVLAAGEVGIKLNLSSVKVNCRRLVQRGILTGQGGRYEITVTPVTAPASDIGTDTYNGYGYTGSEQQTHFATVTPADTLEVVQSANSGSGVWSLPNPATVLPTQPAACPQQASLEPAAKAKRATTVAQTAGAPAAPTTAKKDRGVFRAIKGLGGTASVQNLVDYWKVTDSGKIGEIEAHLVGMFDRCILVREDTPTGTVYSTVGQMRSEVAA